MSGTLSGALHLSCAGSRYRRCVYRITPYAGYAGEQDADPLTTTDRKTGSDRGTIVHAAELQVLGQ